MFGSVVELYRLWSGNLEENFSKLNHRTFKILEPRDTLVT